MRLGALTGAANLYHFQKRHAIAQSKELSQMQLPLLQSCLSVFETAFSNPSSNAKTARQIRQMIRGRKPSNTTNSFVEENNNRPPGAAASDRIGFCIKQITNPDSPYIFDEGAKSMFLKEAELYQMLIKGIQTSILSLKDSAIQENPTAPASRINQYFQLIVQKGDYTSETFRDKLSEKSLKEYLDSQAKATASNSPAGNDQPLPNARNQSPNDSPPYS